MIKKLRTGALNMVKLEVVSIKQNAIAKVRLTPVYWINLNVTPIPWTMGLIIKAVIRKIRKNLVFFEIGSGARSCRLIPWKSCNRFIILDFRGKDPMISPVDINIITIMDPSKVASSNGDSDKANRIRKNFTESRLCIDTKKKKKADQRVYTSTWTPIVRNKYFFVGIASNPQNDLFALLRGNVPKIWKIFRIGKKVSKIEWVVILILQFCELR